MSLRALNRGYCYLTFGYGLWISYHSIGSIERLYYLTLSLCFLTMAIASALNRPNVRVSVGMAKVPALFIPDIGLTKGENLFMSCVYVEAVIYMLRLLGQVIGEVTSTLKREGVRLWSGED